MQASTPQKTAIARPPRQREFRFRWLFFTVAAVVIFCVVYPPVFLFGLRHFLLFEAASHGARLEVREMTGSIYQPVVLNDMTLVSNTPAGTLRRVAVSRAEAVVRWRDVAGGSPLLHSLAVDGVNAEIDLPVQPGSGNPAALRSEEGKNNGGGWLTALLPESVSVTRANLVVTLKESLTTFNNVNFTASGSAPGTLEIGRMNLREPWLSRTFSDVKGTTALQKSKLIVGALKLEDGMVLDSLSADLGQLAQNKTAIDFTASVFGGVTKGDVLLEPSNGRVHFDASGSFSQISLEDVARFVGSREPAGGVIKEGKFTFHGSPREIDKATIWVWLEATDFLWGKRRWNSLVAGATIFDRKLRIPEFRLQQSHNELALKGEIAIPPTGREWWQSQFDLAISAKIGSLTELSALFGPRLEASAGQMTIDGSVKGQNEFFNGELAVAGSHLSYGAAPLDSLKADIKLNGNELAVTSIDFSHKGDFLRGKGVVNILGQKRYWGQLQVSVADLSLYSAFFVQPFAPQAFAGGLFLDWSGDGAANAHSGAFRAQFKDLRPLVTSDPKFHPLNVDVEGTYAPGNIFFSKFSAADAETSFSATVALAPSTLSLQAIKLQHRGTVWMQGDAVLPVSVWNLWQARPWSEVIDLAGPLKVNLAAQTLRLHEAALLTGRDLPIKGEIDMKLTGSGSPSTLMATGSIRLRKGAGAVSGFAFSGVDADITVAGQDALIDRLTARLDSPNITFGKLDADGRVAWKSIRDATVDIAVRGKDVSVSPAPALHLAADVDLRLAGPRNAVRVSGTARILSGEWTGELRLGSLLDPASVSFAPPALALVPFSGVEVRIACRGTNAPFKSPGAAGDASFDLQLAGPAHAPRMTGRLGLASVVSAGAGSAGKLSIEEGAVYYEASDPSNPRLCLKCSGAPLADGVSAFILGPSNAAAVVLRDDIPAATPTLLSTAPKMPPEGIYALPPAPPVPSLDE